MNQKNPSKPLSTYARVSLSDWQGLAKLIDQHSPKKSGSLADSGFFILSDEQVENALNGPFGNFFRQKMSIYSKIAVNKQQIAKKNDEAFKEVYDSSITTQSEAELNKKMQRLDEIAEHHFQAWISSWQQWCNLIAERLAEQHINMTDSEYKNFVEIETIAELNKRFSDLNLLLPKTKSKVIDFETFLRYKSHLAIHSTLSRIHQPNTQEDIERVLKSLKKEFSAVKQAEKSLLTEQLHETQMAVQQSD